MYTKLIFWTYGWENLYRKFVCLKYKKWSDRIFIYSFNYDKNKRHIILDKYNLKHSFFYIYFCLISINGRRSKYNEITKIIFRNNLGIFFVLQLWEKVDDLNWVFCCFFSIQVISFNFWKLPNYFKIKFFMFINFIFRNQVLF